MAGKTLPGIGEDESGEHDVADESDPSGASRVTRPMEKQPPARGTDRMPMATLFGAPAFVDPVSGPTSVDDDKVAEGLKKLRSLDEPLGPIPTTIPPSVMPAVSMPASSMPVSSMPTMKEGMPAIGASTPHVATPALTAAELIRSRGTSHGHALSVPAKGQGLVPMTVDDRLKGTLLGHSLHLPDEPGPAGHDDGGEHREVRAMAKVVSVPASGSGSLNAVTTAEVPTDFSHGDARFFETEPVNNELEPERARGTTMARGAIVVAAISVFVVAGVAWYKVHSKGSDKGTETASTEATAHAPEPAAPATAPAPENVAAPTAPAEAANAPAPAPVLEAAKAPAPSVPAEATTAKPARDPAEAEAARIAKAAALEARATQKPPRANVSTHSSRPPESHHTTVGTKPAAPGKALKPVEDPDGTLPLTE